MSTKSSNSRIVKSPFNDSDLSTTSDYLLKPTPRPKNAISIEKLEVKPSNQRRIPLGSFTEANSPKGFLIELDPDPMPNDSVVTEVTTLGSHGRFTLYLHVANYGTESVHAEVWKL